MTLDVIVALHLQGPDHVGGLFGRFEDACGAVMGFAAFLKVGLQQQRIAGNRCAEVVEIMGDRIAKGEQGRFMLGLQQPRLQLTRFAFALQALANIAGCTDQPAITAQAEHTSC